MSETSIVKIAIGIYVCAALGSAFILWRSAGASDALKNAGIAVASVLTLFLAVASYFTRHSEVNRFSAHLFYDSLNKSFITGDPRNPYARAYSPMYANLAFNASELSGETIEESYSSKGLDLIEKGVLVEMMMIFQGHWDFEFQKYPGPVAILTTFTSRSKQSGIKHSLDDIASKFKHNGLIRREIIHFNELVLPPKTDIKVDVRELGRTIIFENSYTETKIDISFSGGGVAQQGIKGVIDADAKNENRYQAFSYALTITMTPKLLRQYAPEMAAYRRWFKNISNLLSPFDWERIAEEIEKSKTEEAREYMTRAFTPPINDGLQGEDRRINVKGE